MLWHVFHTSSNGGSQTEFQCKKQHGLWVKEAGSQLSDPIAPNIWTSNGVPQCLLIVILHISIYTTIDIYKVYGIDMKNWNILTSEIYTEENACYSARSHNSSEHFRCHLVPSSHVSKFPSGENWFSLCPFMPLSNNMSMTSHVHMLCIKFHF